MFTIEQVATGNVHPEHVAKVMFTLEQAMKV